MYKEQLIAFYKRYNPACLESVDEILDIFKGREEELFHVLEEKYVAQEKFATNRSNTSTSVTPTALPVYSVDNFGEVELDKVPRNGSFSLYALCERLSEALKAKRDEVSQLMTRLQSVEGQLKECSRIRTAAPVSELSERRDFERTSVNRELAEKLRSCENESASLGVKNRELRREVVVLQAENEALRRQKKIDEDTLVDLQKLVDECKQKEHRLLEKIAARELATGTLLHEDEFLEIIRSSQQQLRAFYEDKISTMQDEMDRFYSHASACIREKNAIIDTLKSESI
ncbi:hypothetical protein MNV84_01547 [Leishmania braziliensis]|nr:hypothetical protein MNV84_01547 [Leishmania braziliensis]